MITIFHVDPAVHVRYHRSPFSLTCCPSVHYLPCLLVMLFSEYFKTETQQIPTE